MSPIDPVGAGAPARAVANHPPAPAARSGMDKVASLQSHATATAAAPVETTQAVL